jgi:hypothetical protein
MLYQVPFYGNMARDFSKAGIVDPEHVHAVRHKLLDTSRQ